MRFACFLACIALLIFSPGTAYSQHGELTTGTWSDLSDYDPDEEVVQEILDHAMGASALPADLSGSEADEIEPHEPTVVAAAEGSSGARLVDAAADLVLRYKRSGSFPYGNVSPRVGCALVVNTALDNAGMRVTSDYASRVRVVWREDHHPDTPGVGTVDKLLENEWVEVTPPPYEAGDIVTWNTLGGNVSAEDARGTEHESHIGIIMASGNNVMAMSNDSVHQRPRIHPVDYNPIVRVLRRSS